jgi:adenosylcobinamide-GDP ribazoletransferase
MDAEPQTESIRTIAFEAILAIAAVTLWPILDERGRGTAAQRARALVFMPVVGLALGVVMASLDYATAPVFGPFLRSFIVLLIGVALSLGLAQRGFADTIESLRHGGRLASTGLARVGPIAAFSALIAFVFEVWVFSRMRDQSSRAAALVIAMMLSRWSLVPIGYGLKPLERWGLGIAFDGGLTFREFAVSSVIALGLTMGLYRNIGLLVIVAIALVILALRLIFSRALGGITGFALAGGCAVVEIAAIGIVALLGS